MNVTDAARLRLEQARESLKEAKTLQENSLFRGTVNRAYYAMFYAVMALAAQKDYVAGKHSGMIAFFDREFVKTGIFPPAFSRSLHLGFDRRQSSDYGEVWAVDEAEAAAGVEEAAAFVREVEAYLKKS
jgi:uncharacterized protein (UPF0332 family)